MLSFCFDFTKFYVYFMYFYTVSTSMGVEMETVAENCIFLLQPRGVKEATPCIVETLEGTFFMYIWLLFESYTTKNKKSCCSLGLQLF